MKIVYERPPNYDTILAVLKPQGTTFFCYGDTIYSPSGTDVPEDVIFHESIHSKQQGTNPEQWWREYLLNKDFRLEQELEAYAAQLNFVEKYLGKKAAKECLFDIAQSLSISYNFNMTHPEAESKIRNKAKEI